MIIRERQGSPRTVPPGSTAGGRGLVVSVEARDPSNAHKSVPLQFSTQVPSHFCSQGKSPYSWGHPRRRRAAGAGIFSTEVPVHASPLTLLFAREVPLQLGSSSPAEGRRRRDPSGAHKFGPGPRAQRCVRARFPFSHFSPCGKSAPKSMQIHPNPCKSMYIHANPCKSM